MIKKYHVSKNLFFEKIEGFNISTNGGMTPSSSFDLWVANVTEGNIYTASNVNGVYGFYSSMPQEYGYTYDNTRYTFSGSEVTFTVPQGANYVAVRSVANTSNCMLNTGQTALPYEPYSSEVWHTIPYKRYESGEWVEYNDKKYENGEWS